MNSTTIQQVAGRGGLPELHVHNDAAEAQMVRMQLRDELSSIAAGGVPAAWNRWNLERLGFTTTQVSSVDAPDESALSED